MRIDGRTHNRMSIEMYYRSCVSNAIFSISNGIYTDEGARMLKTINNKNDPSLPPTTAPERFLMEFYPHMRYEEVKSNTFRIARNGTDMGKRVSSFILNCAGSSLSVNSIEQYFFLLIFSYYIFSRFSSQPTSKCTNEQNEKNRF